MSVSIRDKTTGEWVQVAGGTMYADSPIGSIIPYGGTTAPDGFLLCQGQEVSKTTYAELFAVIGTSFGSGDSSTTFNVPDLRGKVPVGLNSSDTEFNTLGKTGGEKAHQLTINEMPSHNHLTGIVTDKAFEAELKSGGGATAQVLWTQNQSSTGVTGGDGTHNNIQPYNTVNYIIKATQVGVPADFAPVDVVENGNMNAVTSNAVAAVNMDSAISIDTTKWSPAGQVHAFKVGQFGIINWGGNALVDISTDVNNGTKVAQLPVEFRPNIAATGILMTIGGTVADLIINAAGEVFLCSPSGTLKTYNWAWGQVVFVIGN